MKAYDLYGFKGLTLDQVRSVVEKMLDVRFVPHESSFWGEYYKCGGNGSHPGDMLLTK
jgi:hypothetical protein